MFREFQGETRTYKGFNQEFHDYPDYLAMYNINGDIQIYALDDMDQSLKSLNRYLYDDLDNFYLLQVYKSCQNDE